MTNETDLRLNYKLEPGDVLVNDTISALNESIRNILNTFTQSRLFNRSFGSNLPFLLFEPMSAITANIIRLEIKQVLDRLEPRLEVIFSESQIIPIYDKNEYRLRIVYRVIESEDIGEFNTFVSNNG